MLLNVGCGHKAVGDVNVDLFPDDRSQCGIDWEPKKVKNFVLADVCFLPFRDNVFSGTYASHVLEHVVNPLLATKELSRVCFGECVFVMPSEFHEDSTVTHLFTWNPFSLKNLMKRSFKNVETGYTKRLHNGLGPKVFFINLLYRIFNVRSEIFAICSN